MKLSAVIFDLDDTLVDSTGAEERAWVDVSALLLERFPDADPTSLRLRYLEALHRWYPDLQTGRLDLETYRRARLADAIDPWGVVDDELFGAYTRAKRSVLDVRPLPGAVETLRRLRSGGIRAGVLTNGPGPFQRLKLSAASLTEELDAVAISAELGWAKPERAAYHGALRLLGARGEETAMVGDSLDNDVVGALRAGVAAAVWLDSRGRRGLPVEGLTASSLAGAVAALGLDTV